VPVLRRQEALVHVVFEADAALALPALAHLRALVALRLVVNLVARLRTRGLVALTVDCLRALLHTLALEAGRSSHEPTGVIAAFALAGGALHAGLPRAAGHLVLRLAQARVHSRMAALLRALVLVEAAVALLSLLHNLVATERSIALLETVGFSVVHNRVQDGGDVLNGAVGELVVVVPVPGGGRREHDVVPLGTAWPAFRRIVVRRAKVVPDLVGQGQLRHLRGHAGVVVHKRDDPCIETPFGLVMDAVNVFGVGFVLLANAAAGATSARHPGQAQGSTREISVGEHIREAEVLVVLLAVQVQEVGHVNVVQAERVRLIPGSSCTV